MRTWRDGCTLRINPDGKFPESDRARQRGFAWCGQRPDGMSIGNLVASPDLLPLAYHRQAARTRNHSFLYENFRGLNRLGPVIGAGVVGHRPNRRSQVIRDLLETTLRSLAFGDPVLHRTAERCAAAFSTPATAAQPEVPLCQRAAEVTDVTNALATYLEQSRLA